MQFDPNLQLEKARKQLQDTAQKFLKSQHAFHTAMADAHETSAEDFQKENSEHIHHTAAAAAHRKGADNCAECMAECSKVVWSDLFKAAERPEPVASPISAVTPTLPGVTAVPRAGQRPMNEGRPNVPVQFEKLIVIEE
jgi:hypothetical protein